MLTDPDPREPDKSITSPKTAIEDRKMLGISIPMYRLMADSLSKNEILMHDGKSVPIQQVPRKKLKGMKKAILNHQTLSNSMIYKEMFRRIKKHLVETRDVNRHPSELNR